MQTIEVLKVFAFDSHKCGGNAAGVVLNALRLAENEMQSVAAKARFSETVFVSEGAQGGFRTIFYTPTRKVADCGHATVAAFAMLKVKFPELIETTKELDSAIRKIYFDGNNVFMEQPIAEIQDLESPIREMAGLFKTAPPFLATWHARHDVGFCLLEVEDETALNALAPDLAKMNTYSLENDLVGFYVFLRKQENRLAATTRMFAPAYGIPEESATGMAAGLLASLLNQTLRQNEFDIEQGRFMQPPSQSLIVCKFSKNGSQLLVGGSARLAETLHIEV